MPFDSTSPGHQIDLSELRVALIDRLESLAECLLGPHNKARSRRTQWRWGANGSLSVEISGRKRGAWHSHEAGQGGGPIELVAFARQCSFPDAVTWSAEWVGIQPANDADANRRRAHDAERQQAQEAERAKREAETAADERRRINKAQRTWDRTVPIAGTIGERYLTSTRAIPLPAGGWPECVRWLPSRDVTWREQGPSGEDILRTLPAAGAVVLAAVAEDGNVRAVQRIYVDAAADSVRREDGRKVKLTDGAPTGAAVRLQEIGETQERVSEIRPILLAEGPETGLSVWVSTGHETHFALGNLKKLRPPRGRRLVLCRDDDKPESPADKALRQVLKIWGDAGIDVVVATPWQVRRGDKSDFNDVVREAGVGAVLAQVAAALNPEDDHAPPQRVSVGDGRRMVATKIEEFFADAPAWNERTGSTEGATPSESEDDHGADTVNDHAPPPGLPVHLVQIDTGGGKSDAARRAAAHALVGMRGRGDTNNLAMLVPTHELGSEQLARFEALPEVRAAKLRGAIWRGRNASDPANPTQKMCRNLDLFREVQALKLDAEKQACGICPHGPNSSGGCAYLAQRKQQADLWFAAHNMMFEAKPKAIGKLAAVIVDESPLGAALDGVEWTRRDGGHRPPITLPLEALARVDRVPSSAIDTDRLMFLRHRALDAIDAQADGPLVRQSFVDAGLTAVSAAEAHRLEWRTLIDVELSADMSTTERHAVLAKAARNSDLGRRVIFWRAVQAMLSTGGPDFSGWCAVVTDPEVKPGHSTRYLDLKRRRELGKAWRVPTLVLDATATPELLRYLWPSLQQTANVRLCAPHQHIRQTTDRDQSLGRLDVDAAWSDAVRRRRQRSLRDMHAMICREARALAPGAVLVVAQQRIESSLLAMGNLPTNVEMAHHNALRGIDRWGDVAGLIVLGRTLPPSTAIKRMTEALTGVAQESVDYERAMVVRELAGGRMQPGEWHRYGDMTGEALRWQACEAEVVQIIGRARGVNRTADHPVSILVLSDIPLPLPVEPVTLDSLDPSPADLMMAAGGLVLTNPTDAAAAYPHLWGNREAAKKAMQRGQLGTNPYKYDSSIRECPHLVRVEYRRDLERHGAAVAWCDPHLVPDPAGNLTRAVGPLAWCKVTTWRRSHGTDATTDLTLLGDEAGMEVTEIAARPDPDKLAIRSRLQVGCEPPATGATPDHDGSYGDPTPAELVLPTVPWAPVNVLGDGDLAGLLLRRRTRPAAILLCARGAARPRATAILT